MLPDGGLRGDLGAARGGVLGLLGVHVLDLDAAQGAQGDAEADDWAGVLGVDVDVGDGVVADHDDGTAHGGDALPDVVDVQVCALYDDLGAVAVYLLLGGLKEVGAHDAFVLVHADGVWRRDLSGRGLVPRRRPPEPFEDDGEAVAAGVDDPCFPEHR